METIRQPQKKKKKMQIPKNFNSIYYYILKSILSSITLLKNSYDLYVS